MSARQFAEQLLLILADLSAAPHALRLRCAAVIGTELIIMLTHRPAPAIAAGYRK